MAILDQEEAKKFLTGKASDKYDFFMKATELERIDRSYQTTLDSMNDMGGQKMRMENNLEHDQSLVKQCKEEWDKNQELDKLKEKKEKLMEGLAWSCYQKAQQTLDLEIMVSTWIRCCVLCVCMGLLYASALYSLFASLLSTGYSKNSRKGRKESDGTHPSRRSRRWSRRGGRNN